MEWSQTHGELTSVLLPTVDSDDSEPNLDFTGSALSSAGAIAAAAAQPLILLGIKIQIFRQRGGRLPTRHAHDWFSLQTLSRTAVGLF